MKAHTMKSLSLLGATIVHVFPLPFNFSNTLLLLHKVWLSLNESGGVYALQCITSKLDGTNYYAKAAKCLMVRERPAMACFIGQKRLLNRSHFFRCICPLLLGQEPNGSVSWAFVRTTLLLHHTQ